MSDEPTLDVEIFRTIRTSIEKLGGAIDSLLAKSRLPSPDIEPESGEVSELRVWDLFHRSARSLELPRIGLLAGQDLQVRDLGVFGQQLKHCLTVKDCIEFYVRQVNHHSSHSRYWFAPAEGGIWFCRGTDEVFDVGRAFVEQFVLQLMIRMVQLGAGPEWYPDRVRVQTRHRAFYRGYQPLANTETEFRQSCTAVRIPKRTLGLVIRRDRTNLLLNMIRDRIACTLDGPPRLDTTAKTLGFSKRTLQRELSKNNISWKRLVDQVRVDTAIQLLMSRNTRTVNVAVRLGYTDSSNFARAFIRWTGTSPQTYCD